MNFVLAAIGRAKSGPERDLFVHYAARLKSPLLLREYEEKRPLPTGTRMEREGEMLLEAIPGGARVVVLDERGRTLSSRGFAEMLGNWRDQSVPAVAFLIGGADGHSHAVRERADFLMAFGPMTWPHMLVRGMLAEQIYRAQSIHDGHPYHRD